MGKTVDIVVGVIFALSLAGLIAFFLIHTTSSSTSIPSGTKPPPLTPSNLGPPAECPFDTADTFCRALVGEADDGPTGCASSFSSSWLDKSCNLQCDAAISSLRKLNSMVSSKGLAIDPPSSLPCSPDNSGCSAACKLANTYDGYSTAARLSGTKDALGTENFYHSIAACIRSKYC